MAGGGGFSSNTYPLMEIIHTHHSSSSPWCPHNLPPTLLTTLTLHTTIAICKIALARNCSRASSKEFLACKHLPSNSVHCLLSATSAQSILALLNPPFYWPHAQPYPLVLPPTSLLAPVSQRNTTALPSTIPHLCCLCTSGLCAPPLLATIFAKSPPPHSL